MFAWRGLVSVVSNAGPRQVLARTIQSFGTHGISTAKRQGQKQYSWLSNGNQTFNPLFRQRFALARARLQQRGHQQRTFAKTTSKKQYGRRQAFNYQTFQSTKGIFYRWAARPTFYYEVGGITLLGASVYVYNLEHVPVSDRYRFNIVSAGREKALGRSMYNETMQEYGQKIMPEYTYEHRLVKKVLDRLVPHSGLEGDEWEVHVIDDPMKNAFVIPGGKVFVFRGIMDVARGEDGLAAVLGHEIAHNVAHHAAERMSQNFALMIPAMLILATLGVDLGIGRFLINLAFTLPGSRAQESEADYIGLMMMSEACYQPQAAMRLWAAMEQAEKGQGGTPPQFVSTHPSSHNRLEKIREWLPKAEDKREQSECGSTAGYADAFRRQMGYPTTVW